MTSVDPHSDVPLPDPSPGPVAGLGQCSLDYLCTVERYPEADAKCEFQDFRVQGGGPVATALVVLARWGIPVRFSGLVCRDFFGDTIRESLQAEGVDASAVVVRARGQSQFAFICADQQAGTRTVFWRRPDVPPIAPEEVPETFLDGVQALHLDGLFVDASLHLAREARARGIPVVLDAGAIRPGMLELVRYTDHLIAAETFLEQFAPGRSAADALRKLKGMGPELVSVTCGRNGSITLSDQSVLRLPSLSVVARDTTGAGDVFHGAYIYALLRGWPPLERIRWATVSAALSCLALGGRTGIPTLADVRARIDDLGPFTELAASEKA